MKTEIDGKPEIDFFVVISSPDRLTDFLFTSFCPTDNLGYVACGSVSSWTWMVERYYNLRRSMESTIRLHGSSAAGEKLVYERSGLTTVGAWKPRNIGFPFLRVPDYSTVGVDMLFIWSLQTRKLTCGVQYITMDVRTQVDELSGILIEHATDWKRGLLL